MGFCFPAFKKIFKDCGLPQKSGLNLQTNAENVVQRFCKIIVALCLVVYGPALVAQQLSEKIPEVSIQNSKGFGLLRHYQHPKDIYIRQQFLSMTNTIKYEQAAVELKNHAVAASINSSFYTQQFGFFCKKELQLENTTKVPLRFRLGSLDYCNYLEAKNR
jgi:hypothetical protein